MRTGVAPVLHGGGGERGDGQVDAENRPDTMVEYGLCEPDGAGDHVAVSQDQRAHAAFGSTLAELLGVGGAKDPETLLRWVNPPVNPPMCAFDLLPPSACCVVHLRIYV